MSGSVAGSGWRGPMRQPPHIDLHERPACGCPREASARLCHRDLPAPAFESTRQEGPLLSSSMRAPGEGTLKRFQIITMLFSA